MIKVQNLHKTFKVNKKEPGLKGSVKSLFSRKWIEKKALVDVSLSIGEGEILGLVGANGAGKTTLVKILSGIIHPTSGSAQVLGFDPWERHNEFRKQIALIMGQKAQLWWDLPAEDCFLLLREIYQIPKKQYEENLSFLSNTLNISEQMNIQIRRLSLGERMKMELIAALMHNPRVVFLDEPTIGLDLTAQRAIRQFLLNYRQKHRPAMILTSHYMEDIEQLCKRIIILRQGSVVYDGQLNAVSKEYADQKIISVTIKNGSSAAEFNLPKSLGTVVSKKTDAMEVKVRRESIAEAASYILKNLPVNDLTIKEEDISDIIEALIREG